MDIANSIYIYTSMGFYLTASDHKFQISKILKSLENTKIWQYYCLLIFLTKQ